MKVPACPIPIHQTKLTIANPQATGMLIPQIPTPIANRVVIPYSKPINRRKPIPKLTHQKGGCFRSSTIPLIWALVDSSVAVGLISTSGGLDDSTTSSSSGFWFAIGDQCRSGLQLAESVICPGGTDDGSLAWNAWNTVP